MTRKIYIRAKQPDKRYRNYEEFKSIQLVKDIYGTSPKRVSCPDCWGHGKHYHPDDSCPIEGYKMATRRVVCTRCNGSGSIPEKELRDEYRRMNNEFKEKKQRFVHESKKALEATKKLKPEELDLIMKYIGVR
jgi:hypothetical protein